MSHYHYTVFGAGRQGTAAAYDLALRGEAARVVVVDSSMQAARRSADRVNEFVGAPVVEPLRVDLRGADESSLVELLKGTDAVISAVPYFFNLQLSKAAVTAGANICDLGGHTGVVIEQLALDKAAETAGISIIPDCGQVPGLGNSLAVYAMEHLDVPEDVTYWDGGLPQHPEEPLGYKMTFSAVGLTNEYRGEATFLRDGQVVHVPALTGYEIVDIPDVGEFEAFVTSGGTSTCPWTFAGKLRTFENRTIRYPGHFDRIRFLEQMGLLDEEPLMLGDASVSPRDVLHSLLEKRFRAEPDMPDIVIIYLKAKGLKGGMHREVIVTLVHRFDPDTGFTAMEQTTGWHASIVAAMMARRQTLPGAKPVEVAVSASGVVEAMRERGIHCQVDIQ